jgi:NMT1-like family
LRCSRAASPSPRARRWRALAAVFLEPLLIFHRGETERAVDPVAWAELRVAAGEPGSGTRAAVLAAARALALPLTPEMLLPIGGTDAVQALLDRRVDVAVFVAPVTAPYLEPLFQSDEVRIAPIRDAEALARRLPYVRMVDIPPAALDYARRIPDERVPLVAMVAALVARDDLHPALVNRLVRAAERIHAGTDLVNVAPIFPSSQGLGLPVNAQAAAALENGPDAFERLLPYWMSAQVSRFALLLVPIVVLLLPLFRLLPGFYAWRMHSRIYRRYQELKTIEREAESGVAAARLEQLLARLERIDAEARSVRVPPRYREYAYTLRMHIDLVRRKLAEQAADS